MLMPWSEYILRAGWLPEAMLIGRLLGQMWSGKPRLGWGASKTILHEKAKLKQNSEYGL